jgi:predicted LPLAT superfamily acyltransferase
MKTITQETVKIKDKEVLLFVESGKLMINTKLGNFEIVLINKSSNELAFKNGEKRITVKFEGNAELVNALLNSTKTEKNRSLVIFDSFEEYVNNSKKMSFGDDFYINGLRAAYLHEIEK